jgi:hypothetical protein
MVLVGLVLRPEPYKDNPCVKMKNFRDKWVGSSEGKLEKIFRLIHALAGATSFID